MCPTLARILQSTAPLATNTVTGDHHAMTIKTSLIECLTTGVPGDSGGSTYSTTTIDEMEEDILEGKTTIEANCSVCDMRANGMYFGALVCLPCKSFFIRCTKECEPKFTCLGSGLCDITKTNRLRCQHCRYKKCLAVGMCRKEKPIIIEPEEGQELCKVCGDIANGIHFGVPTCEGCKKFFRRALKEATTYFCKYERHCVLNPRNRNSCRYCRYQKCIEVGMSRNAIRMGRPKKSHDKLSMRVADLSLPRDRGSFESQREMKHSKRTVPYYITSPGAIERRQIYGSPNSGMENEATDLSSGSSPPITLVDSEMTQMTYPSYHHEEAMSSPALYGQTTIQEHVCLTRESPTGSPVSSDSSFSSAPETVVDVEEDLNNILCTLQHYNDTQIALAARNAHTTLHGGLPHVEEIAPHRFQRLTPALPRSPDSTPYDLSNQLTPYIQYAEPKQEVDEHLHSHCTLTANGSPMVCDTDHGIPRETVPSPYSEDGTAWEHKSTDQSLYTQMYDSLMTAYNITNEEPSHAPTTYSGQTYTVVETQPSVCTA